MENIRHQDILGSLFALNIDSSYFGDIVLFNDYYYVFVSEDLALYIKDNLKMACKDEKKQIEICKKVGIHELIQSMPKGYDTILNENAANLSGGQKRLLSLAKTLLTDSKVLLFDEVTSSLDIKTTNKIISILKELKDSHTVIIITHHLSCQMERELSKQENSKMSCQNTMKDCISYHRF